MGKECTCPICRCDRGEIDRNCIAWMIRGEMYADHQYWIEIEKLKTVRDELKQLFYEVPVNEKLNSIIEQVDNIYARAMNIHDDEDASNELLLMDLLKRPNVRSDPALLNPYLFTLPKQKSNDD